MWRGLADLLPYGTPAPALDLLAKLTAVNPRDRPSARDALVHPFFWDEPKVAAWRSALAAVVPTPQPPPVSRDEDRGEDSSTVGRAEVDPPSSSSSASITSQTTVAAKASLWPLLRGPPSYLRPWQPRHAPAHVVPAEPSNFARKYSQQKRPLEPTKLHPPNTLQRPLPSVLGIMKRRSR